jgi:hypothetical protein
MNRGRHKKKKIIRKATCEDILNYINSMEGYDAFFNFKNNTQYWFNPYFLINEQGTTSKIHPTSCHTNIR